MFFIISAIIGCQVPEETTVDPGCGETDTAITDTGSEDTGDGTIDEEFVKCEGTATYDLTFDTPITSDDSVVLEGHYSEGYVAYREGSNPLDSEWAEVSAYEVTDSHLVTLCNWMDDGDGSEFFQYSEFVLTVTRGGAL